MIRRTLVPADRAALASQVPGRMRAWGHDGYIAMLRGADRYLAEIRSFDGPVLQPAEEIGGESSAGTRMVENGLPGRFPAERTRGLHDDPRRPPGLLADLAAGDTDLPGAMPAPDRRGSGTATGVAISLDLRRGHPSAIDDTREAEPAVDAAAEIVGETNVGHDPSPSMAAENLAFLLQEQPDAFAHPGIGGGAKGGIVRSPPLRPRRRSSAHRRQLPGPAGRASAAAASACCSRSSLEATADRPDEPATPRSIIELDAEMFPRGPGQAPWQAGRLLAASTPGQGPPPGYEVP
ncbi:M20/M25/M40 family metallo-hydrolase [Benzoatithermus flavus]|uniref:M20/M25/M40 family metallo-hydrolase n=1 Tax=Benzoatithermus flavus TaxID=3108223 RepID=A0ABU8XS24_9PROT